MARLIDADELEELFNAQIERGATDLFDAFDDALQDAQTVDAVPVVRCKDCEYVKHWKNRAGMSGVGCHILAIDTYPDSFCSFGERKENERS